MSVMMRPCEAAPVTTLPSMMQLTAQLVWPVMTMSIASSMAATIGGSAPVGLSQLLIRPDGRRSGSGRHGAAFVQEDDERLDALALQVGDQGR